MFNILLSSTYFVINFALIVKCSRAFCLGAPISCIKINILLPYCSRNRKGQGIVCFTMPAYLFVDLSVNEKSDN